MELDKTYDPKKYEDEIYRTWEESSYFNPDNLPGERTEKFSMVLPPPNVTGVLHIGHAYETTLQDIVIRFERMRGKRALWVPGTDHAAIATQAKVEKKIYEEEKKTRHDLGREEFLRRVNQFALDSQKTILSQLRKMGLSLDWSRLAYTLDKRRQKAVYEAFHRMYTAGLVYRGYRVINWDPKGQTTVSDEEVIHKETKGSLYTFRYDKNFPFYIATTRPETKLGDTAVAVHPGDPRYKKYVGETFSVNFVGVALEIKVIADDAVDPEFGTGAVGGTPAHSMTDWEMAQRHQLPLKHVIDEQGQIMVAPYKGKTALKAREEIVETLKEEGLLETEKEIEISVGTAERTGATIEPLPKLQWFVNVNRPIAERGDKTLKELMREPVAKGEIKILPEQFEKRYFHWVENLRDWCISRQLWFGHRIPIWYKSDDVRVSEESPGEGWEQDPDTLDTWFSAGLWTFSTLGWPEKTTDLELYHPTDLMNPGYEILFLWVSRMILFSRFLLGEIPFRTALIHGIVRDEARRKFSKSSGVGGDPLEVIALYGTDALRMALVTGTAIGNDPIFDLEKVKAQKHFTNKIWNISRFVLMNLANFDASSEPHYSEGDAIVLAELDALVNDVTADIENFRFHLASEKLYHYIWHTFADKIIEEAKSRLTNGTEEERRAAQHLLLHVLKTSLILLHPFMPFVTEVIWARLPRSSGEQKLLMIETWPHNQ